MGGTVNDSESEGKCLCVCSEMQKRCDSEAVSNACTERCRGHSPAQSDLAFRTQWSTRSNNASYGVRSDIVQAILQSWQVPRAAPGQKDDEAGLGSLNGRRQAT